MVEFRAGRQIYTVQCRQADRYYEWASRQIYTVQDRQADRCSEGQAVRPAHTIQGR